MLVVPHGAWGAVPPGVEPAEVTAHVWELPKQGGTFRADGGTAVDAAGAYTPKPGDRLEVEYRDGLRLSFFNVGAQAGEQYAEARIDYVREYLTPGLEVPKARPKEIGKPVPNAGAQSQNVPAKDVLAPYSEPLYFMRFTGGPNGTFTQTGGSINPNGPLSAQIVRDELDGQHYIELRPLYVRATIDEPGAFLGWPGEEPLGIGALQSEDDTSTAVRLVSYGGHVTFVYPDSQRVVLSEGQSASPEKPRNRMPIGTTVLTGKESFLEMEFDNGARYVLGPQSSMELVGREAYSARLKRGRALVWHPDAGTEAQLRTAMNFGVVGGDGGEWVLEEAVDSSSVTLLSGSARFSVPGSPEVAQLAPGQRVTATSGGLGAPKDADTEALKAEWKALRADAVELEGPNLLTLPGVVPGITLAVVGIAVALVVAGRAKKKTTFAGEQPSP